MNNKKTLVVTSNYFKVESLKKMKNLTVSRQSCRNLKTLENDILCSLRYSKIPCTINPNNDDLYIALQNLLYIIPSDQKHEIVSININNETNNKIIGLEYTNITQQVYCAYENGDLMSINVDSGLECELVTQIPGGLSCIKLSPDHEIITLVTANDIVITMVSSFDIISEVDLQTSNFGEKQFITVGWGKKETQFHGSVGKAAAIVKPVEINKNDSDDERPRITWRGDGSLFAVSFIHKGNDARQFKIFSREGILQCTSELSNNMEESLSWKPSGSLIATTQKLINKHVVSLFEKNGLKHREFSLPSNKGNLSVKEIFWSPDSDILTIWCEQTGHDTMILQLWTENNYHWYLKHTFTFFKDNPLLFGTWSSGIACGKTLVLLTLQNVLTYSFHWTVNHSQGKSRYDKGVVAVIDGKKALLTGFKIGIIPPPMSHQSLECSEPINAIVFAPNVKITESEINSNDFFCVLGNNTLTFFKSTNNLDNLEYENIGTFEIEWNVPRFDTKDVIPIMQHFLWFKENVVLSSISIENQSILCVMNLNLKQGRVTVEQTHIMDGLIEHMTCSPNMDEVFIMLEGSVLKYKDYRDNEFVFTGIKLPQFSHKVSVVQIGTKNVIVSLSYGNRLSIDSKEIANNITSFYLHPKFLLLTTSQHTLICVTLDAEGLEQLSKQNLTIKPWENHLSEQSVKGLNIRRIERGSFLIIALPNDSKTILQMPRGNLECIQPRALSLYIIGEHLKKCEYLPAFDLMRKQRINLNLIYDYEPQIFLQNAYKFVEDINNPQWLSLFLTELQNEDVTSTIYFNCYLNNKKQTCGNENKIVLICDLLRNILEGRQNADHFIQPILISLVKNREKQGLEGALRKLKEIKALESKEVSQSISSEDALKYLLYLVDVNVLFDTALGMYDFELTMFIASKSQKDPKEYVPFLNDLKKLDENFMKYSIDLHLKRYESALNHISKDTERFNECLNLIQSHNLYIKGLKLFKKDSKEYKEVAQIYAKYLLSKSKHKEAAIMFHKANDYSNALNAYKMAGCWQEAIIVSASLNLSPVELRTLYKELQIQLCEDKRYFEAAQILMLYLNDPEEAVTILCDGKLWKDAIRIATNVHRLDLLETHIKPGIQEHAEHIITQIVKNKEDFEKYKTRLMALRIEMIHKQTQVYDDTLNDDVLVSNKGINDFLSDTSSITGSITSQGSRISTTSKRSYRSSKNRRKQERKLLSMREGSAFEDLGLMRALHEIITKTYRQKDELDLLTQMLLYLNDDEGAEKLQDSIKNFSEIIEKNKHKIWDKSAPTSFSEINSVDSCISKHQDTLLPQKLVESHIMYPPEEAVCKGHLKIF